MNSMPARHLLRNDWGILVRFAKMKNLSDYIPTAKPRSVLFIHAHYPLLQVTQLFAGARRLIGEWQTYGARGRAAHSGPTR
jgi:hypothetical protein